jgi:rRNA maturation endonuclease Nob1
MRNTVRRQHASHLRSPREEARLELVSLAAEVATVAARSREQACHQAIAEADLEKRCRTLEEAAARWLSTSTDFEHLSDTDIADALKELRLSQREAVLLMHFGGDVEVRNSARELKRLLNAFISRFAV